MLSYLLLLLLIILIWLFSFRYSEYELCSPTSILCIMFGFASMLSAIGLFTGWNDVPKLSLKTIFVICIGIMLFFCGQMLAEKIFQNNKQEKSNVTINNIKEYKLFILLAIVCLCCFISFLNVLIFSNNNMVYGSFFHKISQYRYSTATFFTLSNVKMKSVLDFFIKLISLASSSILLIVVPIIVINIKNKQNKILPIAILCMCLLKDFFGGGRGTYLCTLFYFILTFWVLSLNDMNSKKLSCIYIGVGVITLIIALPLFYGLLFLTGRSTESDFLDYISFYWGCGIPCLDKLVSGKVFYVENYWGEYVFHSFYVIWYILGFFKELGTYSIAWVNGSNVFTFLGRFYASFGYFGTLLLSFCSGFIYNAIYKKAKNANNLLSLSFFVLVNYSLFDLNREEFIFSRLLSAGNIIRICYMIIFSYFLTHDLKKEWLVLKEHFKNCK